ncbi:hypothetical protein [Salipaludibacillus sp. CF4.18]
MSFAQSYVQSYQEISNQDKQNLTIAYQQFELCDLPAQDYYVESVLRG